ncbi:MAG: glycosyltransferase family 2 protein, partial [Terrimicrobiaceae bacterium]
MKTIHRTRLLLEPASAGHPLLAAILVARDGWKELGKLLEHLRKQTIQSELELVIVADSLEKLVCPASKLHGFHSVHGLELSPLKSVSDGHFSGALLARAALVVFCEEHCFPDPGWAAALVQAHEGPWAAVGPLMRNHNPARAVSRALMDVEHGCFCDPSQAGVRDYLPGHNSCYKKQALLEFSHRLDALQDTEYLLHLEMRQAGWQLFQCAEARTAHTNIALLRPALISCFHSGRCFAASRAGDWPFLKRTVFALGSPLLPFLRHRRHLNFLKHSKDREKTPTFLPLPFLF